MSLLLSATTLSSNLLFHMNPKKFSFLLIKVNWNLVSSMQRSASNAQNLELESAPYFWLEIRAKRSQNFLLS
jgi:hypothetical protein